MGGIGEAPHPCYGRYAGRAPAAIRGGRMVLHELMRMRTSSEGAERAIADYLIAHRSRLGSLDARGIAAEVHVVRSTVVRFCQRLGFVGYASFRFAVQTELSYLISHFEEIDLNYSFDFGDQRLVIAHKIGSLYREIFDDTLGIIEDNAIDRTVGESHAPVAAITSFCSNSLSGLSYVALYVSSRVKRRGRATGIATSFKKQRFRLL